MSENLKDCLIQTQASLGEMVTIKTEACSPRRDQEYGQPWYAAELWSDVLQPPSLHISPSLKLVLRDILELLKVIKTLPCEVCLEGCDRDGHPLV